MKNPMPDQALHCPCTSVNCPNHPSNHSSGCGLCIGKCLSHGEIPSCFFIAVDGFEKHSGYTYRDFAKAVMDKERAGSSQ